MSNQSQAHETVAWAKQRLDEIDALISQVEKTTDKLSDDTRAQAKAALARLQASRAKVQNYYDQLRSEADTVKSGFEHALASLEAEWVEVEAAFQNFLAAVKDQAESTHDLIVSRIAAQRKSWEAAVAELRKQAESVVEKTRGDFDIAITRLSDEVEKFQARIGEAKDAGDESWTAVKNGLADAKVVHDRTIEKIKDAFSKLF